MVSSPTTALQFWLDVIHFHLIVLQSALIELFYFVTRSRPRKQLKNNHILITGTGMGVGNKLARALARDDNTLYCVDVNTQLNNQLQEELSTRDDVTIHVYTCDVSSQESVAQLKRDVDADLPGGAHVEYIINNAGIVHGKLFSETPMEKYTRVMGVNALGPMYITSVFYPDLLEKGGHITNIASTAGLASCPRMVDYSASKHALVGFSRCLVYEHDMLGISNVKVTLVTPHLMRTGMFNNVTPGSTPPIEPDFAVREIIRAIEEEREEVAIPKHIDKTLAFRYIYGNRLFRKYAKIMGNFEFMKTFKNIRNN